MTLKAVAAGERVCPVTCMFFDDRNALNSFLALPGTTAWHNRVISIHNVHRNGSPITIWAVMVGAARIVTHFGRQRSCPNCVLVFEPAKGFNADSLHLVAQRPNRVGMSAHTPLLLNFGADFDIHAARSLVSKGDATFKGALNLLFDSQKHHLKEEIAANEQMAAEEEADAKRDAEGA